MQPKILMDSLRSKNISELIIERIVNSILSGELAPGERLPSEEEFAERLGVGRSSVREAVKILEALGIVEIRRADGTYITEEFNSRMMNPLLLGMLMGGRSAADVCEFKAIIESVCFDQLMRNQTAGSFDTCIDLIDEIEASLDADSETLAAQIVEVQALMGEGLANPLLRELYTTTVRISAHVQLTATRGMQREECRALTALMRDEIAAIEACDHARMEELLEWERQLLLNGSE